MKAACAYYRISSATNVGQDKDSLKRQQDAVRAYAAGNGLEIVHAYEDDADSGADPVDSRDGFGEMVRYMLGNGARTVLVENASRFARDLLVQHTGHEYLKRHGIELIPVDAPTHFTQDTPTARMVREILGAVAALEKISLVARLSKARARQRKENPRAETAHRCEGNPNWRPLPPAAVTAAQRARARGLSLRAVASELRNQGMLNHAGKTYGAQSIARMLAIG